MIKIIWGVLILFVVGNAFFILPYNYTKDNIISNYSTTFKKDTDLLRAVFPDSSIYLQINMPGKYAKTYTEKNGFPDFTKTNKTFIIVNVAINNDMDFALLAFPFYKVANFNALIGFYSIIKIENIPTRDSTVLIGNTTINGNVTIKGFCTPFYGKTLIEKEIAYIFKKEMDIIEKDINRPPIQDTILLIDTPQIIEVKKNTKKIKSR